jgi:predicted peroxiredoxin
MSQKMSVVCNGDTPANIMPTLIFATSGLALDYEVHVFVCPAGARWFLTGELEKLGTPKGMPNPVKLFNDLMDGGGEVVFCELALENKAIKPEMLRDPRIKVKKAPPFLMDVEGACQTYVF